MTLRKKKAAPSTVKTSAQIKTVETSGTTVNVATGAQTSDKVVVLFASRRSQRFALPSGREVFLAHNAINLAGKVDGALPGGGYSVNIIDKADWLEVKRIYGKAFAPWFETGKIVERSGSMSENSAIGLAADNAGDDCGDNPVKTSETETKPDIED